MLIVGNVDGAIRIATPVGTGSSNVLLIVLAASIPVIAHAAKKIPLTDAQYSGSVSVGSKASISVAMTTFEPAPQELSTLAYAGGAYVPVAWKVKENYFFTPADSKPWQTSYEMSLSASRYSKVLQQPMMS